MLLGLIMRGTVEQWRYGPVPPPPPPLPASSSGGGGRGESEEQSLARIAQKLDKLEEKASGRSSGGGDSEPPPVPPPPLLPGGVSRALIERTCDLTNRVVGGEQAAAAAADAAQGSAGGEGSALDGRGLRLPTGGEDGWELRVITPLALHRLHVGDAPALAALLRGLSGTLPPGACSCVPFVPRPAHSPSASHPERV